MIRRPVDLAVAMKLPQEEKEARRKNILVCCNGHFALEFSGVSEKR